jgi:hypothetical protein
MASAGERISSKQVVVKQREFPTREPGERQFKLLGNTAQKKQPKEGGATYVDVQLEPLNLPDGTPNGRAFHPFFLDMAVDPKSGQASYESANGCMAFAQAVGDELDIGSIEQEVVYTGTKAQKKGKTEETLTILNPDELVDYLKAHDGQVVTAYEGLKKVSEKDKAEHPDWKDQNFIVRWVIPEAQMGGSGEPVSGLPRRRG